MPAIPDCPVCKLPLSDPKVLVSAVSLPPEPGGSPPSWHDVNIVVHEKCAPAFGGELFIAHERSTD